jgi:hypothetical protein
VKRFISIVFLVVLVSFSLSAFAQEEAAEVATPLPEVLTQSPVEYLYPGLLPDHPLYFLKSFVYAVRGLFVFGDEAKARWHLKLSDKRAAEARELAEKGKDVLAVRASEKAVTTRDRAIEYMEVIKAQGKDVEGLIEKLEAVSIRQQAVLEGVLEKVPEQAKDAVRKAKERSKSGHEKAIEVLREKEERVEEEGIEGEAMPSGKDCQMLWWFDEDTRVCQKKTFCGMYMYKGLRTFATEKECEAELEGD